MPASIEMTTKTSAAHVEAYDQARYWVDPARNFKSSARLHLQHFLVQNTIGYLVEPTIEKLVVEPRQSPQLKVADLACGNGIWLNELCSTLTRANISAQLDGFDINPINFPNPTCLPTSMSLKQLDILAKPFPVELIGVYGIVHIRAFASVVSSGDFTPILFVASQLLKPGGYLQWEECRGDRIIVESPSPEISKVACDTVVQVLKDGLQAKGIRTDWVDVLGAHFGQYGFQDTRQHRHENRKQDLKGWTEDYLMIWDELATYFPTRSQDPNAQLTREAWLDLFAAAVKETGQGVVVHPGAVINAIGRKPLI